MVVNTPETMESIQSDTIITGFLIVQRANGSVDLIASKNDFERLGLPILQEPAESTIRSFCMQVHEELTARHHALVTTELLLSFDRKADANE